MYYQMYISTCMKSSSVCAYVPVCCSNMYVRKCVSNSLHCIRMLLCVHTYVRIYVRMCIHMYVCTYIRTYICIVCLYLHMYIRTYMRVLMYICQCSHNILHLLCGGVGAWHYCHFYLVTIVYPLLVMCVVILDLASAHTFLSTQYIYTGIFALCMIRVICVL